MLTQDSFSTGAAEFEFCSWKSCFLWGNSSRIHDETRRSGRRNSSLVPPANLVACTAGESRRSLPKISTQSSGVLVTMTEISRLDFPGGQIHDPRCRRWSDGIGVASERRRVRDISGWLDRTVYGCVALPQSARDLRPLTS